MSRTPTDTTAQSDIKRIGIPRMKVLISGAGIAGSCLAHWLAKTRPDMAIKVIERSPKPRVTGQSIDIRGPAIEVVRRMGLLEALRARTTTEKGTKILNPQGHTVASFIAGDTFTAEYEVLRADLAELFIEASDKFDNVRYAYGESITALNQQQSTVDVTFAGGKKETYDVVVAADGSTSRTRPMILGDTNVKDCYHFLGQYIAFYSIPRVDHDSQYWMWYNRPKGLSVMIRPHRNGTTMGVYLCVTTPSHGQTDHVVEAAMERGTSSIKQMLHDYFENAGWEATRVLEGMDKAEDFYFSRAAQVKLGKWSAGNNVVLGDAAWATFGVGTSLAIEGAYVLAGELSKVNTAAEVPAALQRYEQVFRPFYKTREELPPFYPQAGWPQTKWALQVRNSLLWFASRTKIYKLLQSGESGVPKLPNDWLLL